VTAVDGGLRLDVPAALAMMRARGVDGAVCADLVSSLAAGVAEADSSRYTDAS